MEESDDDSTDRGSDSQQESSLPSDEKCSGNLDTKYSDEKDSEEWEEVKGAKPFTVEKAETDLDKQIKSMMSLRMSQCRSSVLASQVEKMFPGVKSKDKRDSLRVTLQQLSETLSQNKLKKEVVFQLPKKSVVDGEVNVVLEEYNIITHSDDKLLSDDFVRQLAVPIQDKRRYKKTLKDFWETTSFVKLQNYLESKYENFLNWFDFWDDTLKVIEGQHGAAVLAYFLFLRWLLYVNMIIFLLYMIFIITPQLLFCHSDAYNSSTEAIKENSTKVYALQNVLKPHRFLDRDSHVNHSGENITANSSMDVIIQHCKELYEERIENSSTVGLLAIFQNILQGTGFLEPTLLFAGFYPPYNITPLGHVYNVSFAFLCVLLATFIISCIMMIKYSSIGVQEAFTAQNTQTNYYSNVIFSCWDYCIKDLTTAGLHHEKIVLELKTNLFEDRSVKTFSKRSFGARVKINAIRLLINAFVIMWLFSSLYIIYVVAVYQMHALKNQHMSMSGLWAFYIQYLPTVTMASLNCISPTIFDMLVYFEEYSSQTKVNLSLVRNVFLYLSSVIILLNTVESHVACKPKDFCGVGLDETCHSPRCFETYVGQQLYKLTLIDMVVYCAVFFCYDLVQYFITLVFDNTLTRFWGHPVFFLPTEVLAPIYSQTVLWLGLLYSPLLPLIMIIKLIFIFYIKKVKILYLCDPARESYRTSKFNSMFILILFVAFFFVIMVHSYALENIPPSRGCGPFRYLQSMAEAVPQSFRNSFSFLMSHWFISIAAIILCSIIHYYWGILKAQKRLVKILRSHLILQSFDKQFLLRNIPKMSQDISKHKRGSRYRR